MHRGRRPKAFNDPLRRSRLVAVMQSNLGPRDDGPKWSGYRAKAPTAYKKQSIDLKVT